MRLVSDSAYEKFEHAFKSSPNHLTMILRSHHAIERELHGSLGMHLVLSPRLDLRKVPFLTKVDLLISLGALNTILYPFFAEVNRLRNRFAHDPEAKLIEDDKIKIKNLYSACSADLAPKGWELSTPTRAMSALVQTVYLATRSSYEQVVNMRARSRALDIYRAERVPLLSDIEVQPYRQQLDKKIAKLTRGILRAEHPDVEFLPLDTFNDEPASVKDAEAESTDIDNE